MIEKIFRPGPRPNSVINEYDIVISTPDGWTLLPPGDAGLTRRVKAAGVYWVVQEKKGRRVFSKGIWTAARTKRIPVERRAEAAVIAWMRHQTTAYDSMRIAKIKGERREVRRMLAQRSKNLLARYRMEGESGEEPCILKEALHKKQQSQ